MKYSIILIITIFLISCNKRPGEGGLGKINGKIIENKYSSGGVLLSTYDKADHDVFIIYGDDDNIFDDKVSTSFDGTFEFNFLNKGVYRIFTYSKCSSCPSGDTIVLVNGVIDKRKDQIDLGTITISK